MKFSTVFDIGKQLLWRVFHHSPEMARSDGIEARVRDTIRCRDCDEIPKVADAGHVVTDHDPPYQVMHNGVKVVLGGYHGDWMRRIIAALKGHHEPQEEKVFHEVLKHLRNQPVMLELGSYWAYYSLWLRKSYPRGRNILVEPVASKLELGQRNFALNGFEGQFVHGCVGREYLARTTFIDWNGDELEMPQYSVDAIVEQQKIDFIDILHADIQGAELEMLTGCETSLAANRIGYFFISTHGDSHDKCLAFFRQRGLRIIAEHSIAESVSADGLIVAQTSAVPEVAEVAISRS